MGYFQGTSVNIGSQDGQSGHSGLGPGSEGSYRHMGSGTSPGSYLRVLPSFRLDLLTDELRDPSDAREGPDPSDPG